MTGLANANFSTMIFSSGAGDYTLDFSGDLQRDATVTITTGLSNLKLVVPKGVAATADSRDRRVQHQRRVLGGLRMGIGTPSRAPARR